MTGPRQTLIEITLTVFSNKAWWTGACVTAHAVHTLSSIQAVRFPGAGLRGAVIHIYLTLKPMGSRWAGAGKAIDEVDTGSSIEAGLGVAFIDIILTVHPLVAWLTYTLVCALIVLACSSIATWV